MQQDPILKTRARTMRRQPTPAEQKLWQSLRQSQLGTKVTRQIQVGPYILDLVSRRAKLAIELDGDTHATQVAYDAARTAFLERQGYRVLRFTNADVTTNLPGVLEAIACELASSDAPHPTLPPRGGGLESQQAPSPHRGEGWGGGLGLTEPKANT
ncbi:endonuclease domain-containing protein [Sphingomonas arantia]|uniref:Endonuclease domain-containing protein n=1 Tax=Sphingomonas arantia TaxID=1460676 RepID=A0ABW4U343_9SPHN